MRIRSVLAATVLAVALAGAGASTAAAAGTHAVEENDKPVCSPYAGSLSSFYNRITWAGSHCTDTLF
ncbi:hypothetical protein SUDANB180_02431 [Streptomyces sp. enrichment culture]